MFGTDQDKWSDGTHILAGQALWYAYGRVDAETPDTAGMSSTDMGYAFMDWYGGIAYGDSSVYRPAIGSEWHRFSTAGRIPASVFVSSTPVMLVPSEQSWKDHTECRGFDSQEFFWHCHSHQVYSNKY